LEVLEARAQFWNSLFVLVARDSQPPISADFKSMAEEVARKGLAPDTETQRYSALTYRVPVPMSEVTAFGSHFISPAHQKGIINAVDFYVPEGTPIRAPMRGEVAQIKENSTVHGISTYYWLKGNGIGIRCDKGEYLWLEHLRSGFATELGIEKGQEVKAGDLIAYGGNTGFSESPHVHMEVLSLCPDTVRPTAPLIKRLLNYSTLKIRFSNRDMPFDIYWTELNLHHSKPSSRGARK
jgi:murein DD-endopeptidase MepM/ murein hydrolase activator NlpD